MAEQQSQQYLSLYPLESVLVSEPHRFRPRTPANLTGMEAVVTVFVAVDAPVHTTIIGVVVSIAIVAAITSDILKSHCNRRLAST